MEDAKPAAAPPREPSPTDDLVEAWLMQWFFNLGLDVTLQNRIRQAADDLKTRLAGQKE